MAEPRENEITVTTVTLTPEDVEVEARKFAMRSGGMLLVTMAEKGLTEQQLADMLGVPKRQIRTMIMGENWRAYLPLAAMCLALGVKMELRLLPRSPD